MIHKKSNIFQYKKKSTLGKVITDPILQLQQEYEIDNDTMALLQKCFRRYDSFQINAIQYYEVDDVYRDMNIEITDRIRQAIIQLFKDSDVTTADFALVCKIYAEIRTIQEKEQEELEQSDTINAFVAMGGNFDRTGFVNKKTIIQTIKNDFQLQFDIEGLLEKAGIKQHQEELSYDEFFGIFESHEEAKELLSSYSQNYYKKKQKNMKEGSIDDEDKEFEVNYKDFEKWQKNIDMMSSSHQVSQQIE